MNNSESDNRNEGVIKYYNSPYMMNNSETADYSSPAKVEYQSMTHEQSHSVMSLYANAAYPQPGSVPDINSSINKHLLYQQKPKQKFIPDYSEGNDETDLLQDKIDRLLGIV